jgi:hypothetical protein
VSPVKFKLGFFIPEDDILHSDRREILKFYIAHPNSLPSKNENVGTKTE